MNILYVTSEAAPFAKTGGLGEVCGSLPHYVAKKGHAVAVMMPEYAVIDEKTRYGMTHVCDFYVKVGWREQFVGVDTLKSDDVTFFFIDNLYYFGRDYIYGSMCEDECERFSFFNVAVAEAIKRLPFSPDIIHCNDWQSGILPYILRSHNPRIKTVYTIHNVHYQGVFPKEWAGDFLSVPHWDMDAFSVSDENISFMKCGIIHADKVTTVSPTYAQEIKTSEIGEGLQDVLNTKNVCGILNGIDTVTYNPYDDELIHAHYASYATEGKAACKESLQYDLWLDKEPDTPLLGMVTRLTEQKGIPLIEHTWEKLMGLGVQLAVVGTGDAHFESFFRWLSSRCGGRVAARIEYSDRLSHRVYAGSDIYLMPSRTEPCGIAQMYAMRYGAVPLVHETGGLRDSVIPYNKYTGDGTGFSFFEYSDEQFFNCVCRAVECYRERSAWKTLVNRTMQQNFAWDVSAEEYVRIYECVMHKGG